MRPSKISGFCCGRYNFAHISLSYVCGQRVDCLWSRNFNGCKKIAIIKRDYERALHGLFKQGEDFRNRANLNIRYLYDRNQ